MGAKQSKRSVDISGKEAENAGEVAAAGAGGEGRMEALADADALKPQLNGDAHIHEQSDKEKQLDSGTPENEKDATTEKESKDQEDDKDKEAPVTNGDNGEQKENGDSTATPEDGKKPKKEKVKKKWSLRSISFSRKEKPKQEKKSKEEEPKTNGEPEKVPEEAAETASETPKTEIVEEVKPEAENKDEKTPETPVTEPITNGSTTPESKVETPAAEEPTVEIPETNRPETETEPEPENLPVNGLSLDEAKNEPTEAPQSEESKPEEPIAETTESASAPETPVKKEVCVEQMPLIEPTPPPLPANPPPSSVASFAATTMAPELTDASLANTTESAILPPPSTLLETKADLPNENVCNPEENKSEFIATIESEANPLPPPLKEINDEKREGIRKTELVTQNIDSNLIVNNDEVSINLPPALSQDSDKSLADVENPVPDANNVEPTSNVTNVESTPNVMNVESIPIGTNVESASNVANIEKESELAPPVANGVGDEIVAIVKTEPETQKDDSAVTPPVKIEPSDVSQKEPVDDIQSTVTSATGTKVEDFTEENSEICISPPSEPEIPENSDALDSVEDLPPPPPVDDELLVPTDLVKSLEPSVKEISEKVETISNHVSEIVSETNGAVENINGNDDKADIAIENHKEDSLDDVVEARPCNGDGLNGGAAAAASGADASPQEPIPVSDKIADLIPEVPVVPELKTDMETTSDVAVAN